MKSNLFFILACLISAVGIAQSGFNYKALIKDANGDIIANEAITIQFQIFQGTTNPVYLETHSPTTDANGIVTVIIGSNDGTGTFTSIDWSADNHFLNVQVDTGDGLVDLGTTQFRSVPYAKMAEKAMSLVEQPQKITNLNYPDGFDNMTPVIIRQTYTNEDYVVPPDKNLYITHILSFAAYPVKFRNNSDLTVFYKKESLQGKQFLTQPLIAGSNEIIDVISQDTFLYGFIVDATVTAVKSDDDFSIKYTVPNNKILVMTNANGIFIDQLPTSYGISFQSNDSETGLSSFFNPILADEGSEISGLGWTGYLMDKN